MCVSGKKEVLILQNDMRDRLVELLSIIPCNAESCSAVCDGRCQEFDDLDRCQIGRLVDHLIANGVIVPQWISVKDRLPNEDTRVLVYLNIKKLDANTYTYFDTDRLLNGKWVRWNSYVTHWMLLPEPPKAKGERKEENG